MFRAITYLLTAIAFGLGGCAQEQQSISTTTIAENVSTLEVELTNTDAELGNPVFIRIVKTRNGSLEDGYLELFLRNSEGGFKLYKTWPICNYSGALGPKLKEGDGQSPEGFYFVRRGQMNPNSSYHLSFNLGFPNAYDRAYGRTGSYLMVHGNCVSIGCYAMTDPVIEEIYAVMEKAFDNGQSFIRVHVFPFPMTAENMAKYKTNENYPFWENLKQGWDWFESHKTPPNVNVANKTYMFSGN